MFDSVISVRRVGSADSDTLEALSRLTGRVRRLSGTSLLAEIDGVPVAAIGMTSGTVLADPGNTPLDVIGALRLTRYRILRQGGQTWSARSRLTRPSSRTRYVRQLALS
jgi:hypothetical protein